MGVPPSINQSDRFAKELGISIAGEKLDCRDMKSFSAQVKATNKIFYLQFRVRDILSVEIFISYSQGSANPAIYWAPEQGCRLVGWQTAFSALVEGDHHLCMASVTR